MAVTRTSSPTTTHGVEILDGRTGAVVGGFAPNTGLQSSPLVTDDPNGTIGVTVAGYNGGVEGVVQHLGLPGSDGAEGRRRRGHGRCSTTILSFQVMLARPQLRSGSGLGTSAKRSMPADSSWSHPNSGSLTSLSRSC